MDNAVDGGEGDSPGAVGSPGQGGGDRARAVRRTEAERQEGHSAKNKNQRAHYIKVQFSSFLSNKQKTRFRI